MEKQMSKEVKFGKNIARVTVILENRIADLDGHLIESKDIIKTVKIEIVRDGEVVESNHHVGIKEDAGIYGKEMKAAGLDPNKKYSQVGRAITEGTEACENIRKAIKEMEEELAIEFEVKTESQKTEEKEIEIAKETVVAAEKEGIENLLSSSDLEVWREQYNDINNEGEEGYIPRRVSREEFNNAVKKLGLN